MLTFKLQILALLLCCSTSLFAQKNKIESIQPKQKSGKAALWRGIAFPGWGQFYNGGKWNNLKGLIATSTELTCLYYAYKRNDRLKDLKKRYATAFKESSTSPETQSLAKDYDDLKYDRNTMLWLFSAIHIISFGEAFVEAHLSNFEYNFQIKNFDNDVKGISLNYEF